MVIIDFGEFPGVNMQDPAGLGAAVFSNFPTFNFLTGAYSPPVLEIPNNDNPSAKTAFVWAYGNWEFHPVTGEPLETSAIYRVEVWVPGSAPGVNAYRVVLHGVNVSFPTLEGALLGKNLSPLYTGQYLQILGTESYGDTLVGGSLDDQLFGYGGNDVLFGGDGQDYLDGDFDAPAGADTMIGGAGNDDYVVNAAGDLISGGAGAGVDLAISSISYTLPTNVEDLSLLDAGGVIGGTGNDLANHMVGNISGNVLRGLGGADTIAGVGGDDLLNGGVGDDSVVGGSGADTVQGGDGDDVLSGLDGNDTLDGGAGNDRLTGGNGADKLLGRAGNDVLFWHPSDLINGGAGTDTIKITAGNMNLLAVLNSRIVDVEQVNMAGSGNNILTLNQQDILDMSSTSNTLKVFGDAGDTISIIGPFVELGDVGAFTRYKVGVAVVLADSDINVI